MRRHDVLQDQWTRVLVSAWVRRVDAAHKAMKQQHFDFDAPIDYSKRARESDPQTSHDAAESIVPFAHRHHGVILAALVRIGEGTFEEIARAAGLTPIQTWKRLSELDEKLRCIEKTGRTRPGSSGRQCTIWRVRPQVLAAMSKG